MSHAIGESIIAVQIGEGVTITGPEDLVQEAVGRVQALEGAPTMDGSPWSREALFSFIRDYGFDGLSDIDLSALNEEDDDDGAEDAMIAIAAGVLDLDRRVSGIEKPKGPGCPSAVGAEGPEGPSGTSWADDDPRWEAYGRATIAIGSAAIDIDPPSEQTAVLARGTKVWNIRTGQGPWVTYSPTTLDLPAKLPRMIISAARENDVNMLIPDGELLRRSADFRKVTVAAWTVEVGENEYEVVPEASLADEQPATPTRAVGHNNWLVTLLFVLAMLIGAGMTALSS